MSQKRKTLVGGTLPPTDSVKSVSLDCVVSSTDHCPPERAGDNAARFTEQKFASLFMAGSSAVFAAAPKTRTRLVNELHIISTTDELKLCFLSRLPVQHYHRSSHTASFIFAHPIPSTTLIFTVFICSTFTKGDDGAPTTLPNANKTIAPGTAIASSSFPVSVLTKYIIFPIPVVLVRCRRQPAVTVSRKMKSKLPELLYLLLYSTTNSSTVFRLRMGKNDAATIRDESIFTTYSINTEVLTLIQQDSSYCRLKMVPNLLVVFFQTTAYLKI